MHGPHNSLRQRTHARIRFDVVDWFNYSIMNNLSPCKLSRSHNFPRCPNRRRFFHPAPRSPDIWCGLCGRTFKELLRGTLTMEYARHSLRPPSRNTTFSNNVGLDGRGQRRSGRPREFKRINYASDRSTCGHTRRGEHPVRSPTRRFWRAHRCKIINI